MYIDEQSSSFIKLLEKENYVSIYQQNLQILVTETKLYRHLFCMIF